MTIADLLAEIGARGIELRRSGDELILRGSKETLDPILIGELRAHKAALFGMIGNADGGTWWSPSPTITPEMLTLVQLTPEEINQIVSCVRGGAENVQDIYPLAPLQEGILFHHLIGEKGDPYLLAALAGFENRARLDRYLEGIQAVIDRHDILRTAIVWKGLPEPVQVVWRKASLAVEEVVLDPAARDVGKQLYARFDPRQCRIDVCQAPLLRVHVAHDPTDKRWLMMMWLHHLVGDHLTLAMMQKEIQAHQLGRAKQLPAPQPFRVFVAQARLGVSRQEHETFFRQMLGDVEEPTAPFGVLKSQGDGTDVAEARILLDRVLALRVRKCARTLGVSAASLCHLAWARVLSEVSGRDDVVFGTVLFGRAQGGAGADGVSGLFINTLPARVRISDAGLEESVRQMHSQLADLMHHEHASLALAQRCSRVPAPTPLFSALLNYRHSLDAAQASAEERMQPLEGMKWLRMEERSNYPFTFSVDDLGEGFMLTAQAVAWTDPKRLCEYMSTTLESLVQGLETAPSTAVCALNALPELERHQLLYEWNKPQTELSSKCVHELFEEQARRTPHAVAVTCADNELSYEELNARSNQIAHHLRGIGVTPEMRVAICVERGTQMIEALLGVLKAGGAYVLLDPAYPAERLRWILQDSASAVLLTQARLQGMFAGISETMLTLDVTAASFAGSCQPATNLECSAIGLTSEHLACIISTSGSTGTPNSIMVEHRGIVRLARNTDYVQLGPGDVVAQASDTSSHVATFEIWGALLAGARLVVMNKDVLLSPAVLAKDLDRNNIITLFLHAAVFHQVACDAVEALANLRYLFVGGEQVEPQWVARVLHEAKIEHLLYVYGQTETAFATCYEVTMVEKNKRIPIGRPVANTRVYILDAHGKPVPVGVAGEIYIGGVGVARGYLNRPELTAERFLKDPFVGDMQARMYRTGDSGKWLSDGTVEFLGHSAFRVKTCGFGIELREIETRLAEHAAVKKAVVVAREHLPGKKRLVAYYTRSETGDQSEVVLKADVLRGHLSARLPESMVPAVYVEIKEWPLTPHGELDRGALPEPQGIGHGPGQPYVAPRNRVEEILCGIWEKVLGIERVGIEDNFFALGGHSLSATQLISRVRKTFDINLPFPQFFEAPTIARLAAVIEQALLTEIEQIPEQEAIRMTGPAFCK
jgi:amino acid adenylation domain-containing protein